MGVAEWIALAVLALAVLGAFTATYRFLLTRIDKGDAELHTRINDVRENFVRRDDHDKHLDRLEKLIESMHKDQREHAARMDARVDNVLTSISTLAATISAAMQKGENK